MFGNNNYYITVQKFFGFIVILQCYITILQIYVKYRKFSNIKLRFAYFWYKDRTKLIPTVIRRTKKKEKRKRLMLR